MKYKYFIIRTINLLLVLGLLASYQAVLYVRGQKEEMVSMQTQINQLEGEKEAIAAAFGVSTDGADVSGDGTENGSSYADGTYTGSAEGFGGPVDVSVTVENGAISDIEITSAAGEDEAYLSLAISIIDDIIENQTTEVDTVSGATYSSTGIKNAVAQALEEAAQ